MLDIKQPFDMPKKSTVNMSKGPARFPQPLPKDPNYYEYDVNDLPEMKQDLTKNPTKAAPKQTNWAK